MKNIKLIFIISLFLGIKTISAQQQNKITLEKFKSGNYINNDNINAYLGKWVSIDNIYTFEISKSVSTFKNKDLDFKSEVLILKLTKTKSMTKNLNKIIQKPIEFLSVQKYKASSIYKDSAADNEIDLILMYKSENSLELFSSVSINGKKSKGTSFPDKIILKRTDN